MLQVIDVIAADSIKLLIIIVHIVKINPMVYIVSRIDGVVTVVEIDAELG